MKTIEIKLTSEELEQTLHLLHLRGYNSFEDYIIDSINFDLPKDFHEANNLLLIQKKENHENESIN